MRGGLRKIPGFRTRNSRLSFPHDGDVNATTPHFSNLALAASFRCHFTTGRLPSGKRAGRASATNRRFLVPEPLWRSDNPRCGRHGRGQARIAGRRAESRGYHLEDRSQGYFGRSKVCLAFSAATGSRTSPSPHGRDSGIDGRTRHSRPIRHAIFLPYDSIQPVQRDI